MAHALCKLAPQLPSLRSFAFECSQETFRHRPAVRLLARALRTVPPLHALRLRFAELEGRAALAIGTAVAERHGATLRRLDMRSCHMQVDGTSALLHALAAQPASLLSMQELCLGKNCMCWDESDGSQDEAIIALCKVLALCAPTLQTLGLEGSSMTADQAAQLCPHLAACTALQRLDLRSNWLLSVSDDARDGVWQAPAAPGADAAAQMPLAGMQALVDTIGGMTQLTALRFSDDEDPSEDVGDIAAAPSLLDALPKLTLLQDLDMGGCHHSLAQLPAVAEAVRPLVALTALALGRAGAHAQQPSTDELVPALCAPLVSALAGLTQLRHLSMAVAPCVDLQQLQACLCGMPHLQELVLNGSTGLASRAEQVGHMLQRLAAVTRLDMAHCGTTAPVFGALAPFLARMPALRKLDAGADGVATGSRLTSHGSEQPELSCKCVGTAEVGWLPVLPRQ